MGINLGRGHIDHLQPRLPEEEKEEQEALFVRLQRRAAVDDPIKASPRGTTTIDSPARFMPHCAQTAG